MDMKEVLAFIEDADEDTGNCILDAAFDRRMDLFPKWDVIYISLPRYDKQERRKILELALNMLITRGDL